MLDDIKPQRGAKKRGAKLPKDTPKLDSAPDTDTVLDAKVDKVDETIELPAAASTAKTATSGKKWWHVFHWRHTHLSKPKWALLMIGLILAIVLAVFGAYKIFKHLTYQTPQQKQAAVVKKAPPKPTTEPSRLTGVLISPELNKRPVTGVMIENSPDARPQSGLKDAGVVFEAIAEGGITRFLALYLEGQPDYIGPVRSVRPYYVDWAMTFDASIAHAGGSPDGLARIRDVGARDLDEFANAGGYRRVSNRYAPHNLYTSMGDLDALNRNKGYTSSSFTSWPRKADKKATAPNASSIDFAVSGFLYSPHYDYNAETDSYWRHEGGQPHKDERSGMQLNPKVVIAMVMDYSLAGDGLHSQYNTIGSGHVYVFQDGTVTEGTWQKTDEKAQITFTDSAGAPIKFNAGQTWLTMVNNTSAVSYK